MSSRTPTALGDHWILVDTVASSDRGIVEPVVANQFESAVAWLSPKPLVSGRKYVARFGDGDHSCALERPKFRLDPATDDRLAAATFYMGEVGVANVALDDTLRCTPDPQTQRFELLHRETGSVVAVCRIHFALRRATNVHFHVPAVPSDARIRLKGHAPCVVWFTGLSGSGKSTVANLVDRALNDAGCHTVLLDGDNVRGGLNRDLGFTEADRAENIRRIGEVARLMVDAGLIVLVSFISPYASERRMARELIGSDRFIEVFVDVPLDTAESRDPKGLYAKARRGKIANFTGIDSPYERPGSPEIRLDNASRPAEDNAVEVVEVLHARRFVNNNR